MADNEVTFRTTSFHMTLVVGLAVGLVLAGFGGYWSTVRIVHKNAQQIQLVRVLAQQALDRADRKMDAELAVEKLGRQNDRIRSLSGAVEALENRVRRWSPPNNDATVLRREGSLGLSALAWNWASLPPPTPLPEQHKPSPVALPKSPGYRLKVTYGL